MSGSQPDWPTPPADDTDASKDLYAAELAVVQKNVDAEIAHDAANHADDLAHAAAERAAELANKAAYEAAIFDVAKGGIDRSRANVDLVQKASSAIMVLYTGALALVFSVSENPLPLRGVMPAVFLGAAIVGSTGYLAFVEKPDDVAAPTPKDDVRAMATSRIVAFINWARAPTINRSYWLRFSVVALGVSLFFVPAPFVSGKATVKVQAVQLTPWPKPPQTVTDYTRTLYQAEVQEAVSRRQIELKTASANALSERNATTGAWWVAFSLGILACFLIPALPTIRRVPRLIAALRGKA